MKAADVPIIVAVNKIDKPVANPGRNARISDLGLLSPGSMGGLRDTHNSPSC